MRGRGLGVAYRDALGDWPRPQMAWSPFSKVAACARARTTAGWGCRRRRKWAHARAYRLGQSKTRQISRGLLSWRYFS
eukprot:3271780-Pleurochrysis_carterae.AAC.1